MKLFRVFNKATGEEFTEDVQLTSEGELYWATIPEPIARETVFFEWLRTGKITLGDGHWETYKKINPL